MPKKSKKKHIKKASDGLITPQHIQDAQQSVLRFGIAKVYNSIQIIEPELTGFITAVAEHLAAHAMFEGGMSRSAAMRLKQGVITLGLNVFEAQHHAVYTYYKDIISGTPVAALDAKPFPALPAEGEEGGACASPK